MVKKSSWTAALQKKHSQEGQGLDYFLKTHVGLKTYGNVLSERSKKYGSPFPTELGFERNYSRNLRK